MKKFLLVSFIVIMVVFSTCFAATTFDDVVGTKYAAPVEKLVKLQIVNGFPDGTFKPDDDVTRAQLCKMLVEGLHLKNLTSVPLTQFSDVTESIWSYSYIKTAVDNGIIVGYPEGDFRPNQNVTYAEATAMIIRAMKLEDKMTDKSWPMGYINEANKYGLLRDVTYEANVNAPASRGETSVALYNMMNKIEDDKLKEELERLEAERKALEEAKKNAVSFGIVSEVSSSSSSYYVKIDGIKSKQEINKLNGSSRLTDSKIEALEDTIIAYRDNDDEDAIDIIASYKSSVLDKAKIISAVSTNTVTFTDKEKWNLTATSTKTTYTSYQFVRVTAKFDEDDGTITFSKLSELGFGIGDVTFAKEERLHIDTTNKVVLIFKGFENTDTIKSGKVTSTEDSNISDYEYGFVTKVTTKSKVTTARIDKVDYEVYSKSDDFVEDAYVVYTTRDDERINLTKSFDVSMLDSSAEIVSSVSGKAGEQVITYKGSSTEIDYYTKSNTSKYKNYNVVRIEVEPNTKGMLEVIDHDYLDSLEDVTFAKGDRVVVDSKTKVFVIFTGLEVNDVVKKGQYTSAAEEANKTYKVSYAWKNSKALEGVTLPATTTVKSGASYTVTVPSKEGYNITASKTGTFKVYDDTVITISYTAKTQYTVTYRLATGLKDGVVTLPTSEKVFAGTSYTVKVPTATGYVVTANPTGKITVNGNTTITISYKEAAKYTVTYKLAAGLKTGVVTLPTNEILYAGTSYTVKVPTAAGYKVTASPSGKITINDNTTITISYEKQGLTPEEEAARQQRIKEAEAAVKAAQEAVNNAQTAYDTAKKEYDNASKGLTAAEAEVKVAKTNLDKATAAVKSAKDEKSKLEKEITSLEAGVKTAEDNLSEVQKDLKAAQYDLEHLAEDASDEEKAAAEKAVADAEKAVTDATSAVASANSKLATAKAKLPAADKKIEDAEAAEDEAKLVYADKSLARDNAEAEVAPYKTKLDTAQSNLTKAKNDLTAAQKALEEAKK